MNILQKLFPRRRPLDPTAFTNHLAEAILQAIQMPKSTSTPPKKPLAATYISLLPMTPNSPHP